MQFHFIAPLVLIPLAYGKLILGGVLSCLMFLTSILSTLFIIMNRPGAEVGLFGPEGQYYNEWVYTKPWCRIGPYVTGILLGYVLFIRKSSPQSTLKMNAVKNLI
jgi:hypothetical protein